MRRPWWQTGALANFRHDLSGIVATATYIWRQILDLAWRNWLAWKSGDVALVHNLHLYPELRAATVLVVTSRTRRMSQTSRLQLMSNFGAEIVRQSAVGIPTKVCCKCHAWQMHSIARESNNSMSRHNRSQLI
jgi:hypothetical protein